MPRIRPERIRWGLLDAAALAVVAIAACFGFQRFLWPTGITEPAVYLVRTLIVGMWLLVPTVMWLRSLRNADLRKEWLPFDTLLRDVIVGLLVAMLFAVMNGIGIKLLFERPLGAAGTNAFRLMRASRSPRDIALLLLGIAVIAPVAEEVFFRGMLYPALRRHLHWSLATLLNACLFAIPHGRSMMFQTFLLALVACIMMEFTGTLLIPVLLHVGTNLSFVAFFVGDGALARATPMWILVLIFVVMNVHLFVAGRFLFGPPRARLDPRRDPGSPAAG